MKCIGLLIILLTSVCIKAQDFDNDNYEYHVLDLLSINDTHLKYILEMYQYWEMEMPYYPDYIIIIEFKDNVNYTKKEKNTVSLLIRSTDVKDLRYEKYSGFLYTHELRKEKRLVLVKYEYPDSNRNNIMRLGDRTLSNYKISRTGLFELTGKTNLARFRKAKYGEIVKSDNAYSSCVFEYNIQTKAFKFIWREFFLGR